MKNLFLFVFLSIFTLTSCAQGEKTFEEKYNIQFVYSYQPDTWSLVKYDTLSSEEKARFTAFISKCLSKYPEDFFSKINLKYIVLGKDMMFDKDNRAAVPDNYKDQMYFSYRESYEDYYIAHTVFHEMNHYAEFSIWDTYRYNWPAWKALYNGSRKGGETAYADSDVVDYYSIGTGPAGFINLYSTLGEEEDRSDLIAFFMNDLEDEHKQMMEKVKTDIVLQKKMKLLLKMYKEKLGFDSLLVTYTKEMLL